ncbi:hypothetical protein [Micromonospora sp. NPDC050695]|uniref:hypothetical protein n=1 Tax=Micromonospora sp. NPDC050695 TaxID=3154938 RepID=UPI0033E66621
MHSNFYSDSVDTQDLRRAEDEHADVRRIIRQRQKATPPPIYRILTITTGSATLALWAIIYADSVNAPDAPIGRAYGSFLAFAGACALAAVVTLLSWLRERDASRHQAEADRIREFQHTRQVKALKDAIGVFLRDGDEAARQVMAHTQNFIDSTGTDGSNVHRFRSRG